MIFHVTVSGPYPVPVLRGGGDLLWPFGLKFIQLGSLGSVYDDCYNVIYVEGKSLQFCSAVHQNSGGAVLPLQQVGVYAYPKRTGHLHC